MSTSGQWSFQNRLGSAIGLLILAAVFSVVAWWLGKALLAAKSDYDRVMAERASQTTGLIVRSRGRSGDRGLGGAMVYLGAGTAITGGIAALSLIGAAFVLFMKSPPTDQYTDE